MMSNNAIVAFSLLLSGISFSEGLGSTSSTKFQVVIPQSLKKEEGFDHRNALFGVLPYGGSIQAPVYYTSNKMCDTATVDPSKGFPPPESGNTWDPPYILMVDRGECTFVTKVRNAQHSGAAAVLIADDKCQCDHIECVASSSQSCETVEPMMADDGSGGDIGIPSFLLFKEDGDAIRDTLKLKNQVRAEMTFAVPNPDGRVEYEYWSRPGDIHSKEFMDNFKRFAVALDDSAQFTPRYSVYDGLTAGCHGLDGTNQCMTLCTNHGRYCANDPDDDLYDGVSGSDVVKESLRRICIWHHYGSKNGVGENWWNYVHEFDYRCAEPEFFAHDDCIQDAYTHAGIDGDKIESCISDSGGVEDDKTNNKLDEEIKLQKEYGVVLVPTSFVNGAQVKGAMTSSSIFEAVCAGYSEGTKPDICSKCALCADAISCVDSKGVCSGGTITTSSGGRVSFFTFSSSMLMVVVIFMGAGYWHYNRTREEMREQVRGILAEYMPLEENDRGMGSGVVSAASSAMNDAMNFATGGDPMRSSLVSS